MKLSIIIPFDKYEKFLDDCLQSIQDQNLEDFETLLVANEEATLPEEMEAYDISLRVITASAFSNTAMKRNIGLSNAQGKYVYFIDCDDYLMPGALQAMMDEADKLGADLVCGKRMLSWFSKSVYETMDDEMNIEQNEKNKDHDKIERFEEKEYTAANIGEMKTDYLLRARHGLRETSVLHILIRNDLIKQNNIRFNEEFNYYADAPFVVQLLRDSSDVFAYVPESVYVKRKHNDPINTPALSQIKDPEHKFDEFIQSHLYCTALVGPDTYIRCYVDTKILKYYTGYFARRMRRSEDDAWRTDRFKTMGQVLKMVNPELVNRTSYSRKLVQAALDQDEPKAQKLIARKLAVNKGKRMLKNKNLVFKHLYQHKYRNLPIEEDTIVFETFRGGSYADSPKYIYEYLAKHYPGKYNFVFVLNDKDEVLPYEGIIVKRFSRKYAYYLGVAKYFVFNVRAPLWFRKREGQVFVETWHGTPLKRLVFDQEEVTAASPTYKAQFFRQKQEWDYLIAANKFSSDIFRSCFMYDGPMLETGYPRNDLLYHPQRDKIAEDLKKELGIPLSKRTILYAPTWRDDEYYGNGAYKFKLKLDLEKMRDELGDEYVVILRTHYYIADVLDLTGLEGFAFNLSKYNDITEIYLMSDILITDYSSVFFDFGGLRRPMLFYTYDLDKYRDVLRGFYIDMEEELPGPLVYTTDEVIECIKNIKELEKTYSDRYDKFIDKFCAWEDGNASQRVVDAVFNGDTSHIDYVEQAEESTEQVLDDDPVDD